MGICNSKDSELEKVELPVPSSQSVDFPPKQDRTPDVSSNRDSLLTAPESKEETERKESVKESVKLSSRFVDDGSHISTKIEFIEVADSSVCLAIDETWRLLEM